MRRVLTSLAVLGAVAMAAGAAAQGLTPGTIKLLSRNTLLTDSTTGEAYVEITATDPGKFLIVGPATLQADFKVNLKPGEAAPAVTTLEILVGGKELRRFNITPHAGAETWKGRSDLKPAAAVGFLMQIDPGPHAYEFKVSGAEKGAGLFLVPQQKSKRPLAANAPLVPPKPPVLATPTPAPTAAVAHATPVPAATPTGRSVDAVIATGGRSVNERIDRYPHEVSLLGGVELPGDSTFKSDGFSMVEARWALGDGRTWAVGLEAGAMHYGGVPAIDAARAIAPFAVNVDLTPVIVHGTWFAPVDGRARPYLAGGPGFAYGVSTKTTSTQTQHEAKVGPAADVALGVEFDLGATDLKEGRQKILLEARESYANLGFAAHDYKNFSSTAVMLGVAMKF